MGFFLLKSSFRTMQIHMSSHALIKLAFYCLWQQSGISQDEMCVVFRNSPPTDNHLYHLFNLVASAGTLTRYLQQLLPSSRCNCGLCYQLSGWRDLIRYSFSPVHNYCIVMKKILITKWIYRDRIWISLCHQWVSHLTRPLPREACSCVGSTRFAISGAGGSRVVFV